MRTIAGAVGARAVKGADVEYGVAGMMKELSSWIGCCLGGNPPTMMVSAGPEGDSALTVCDRVWLISGVLEASRVTWRLAARPEACFFGGIATVAMATKRRSDFAVAVE